MHASGSNKPTTKQMLAIRMLADAIVDSIRDAGGWAPAGPMYAAVMAYGCTLDSFNAIMAGLVRVGRLERENDCYKLPGVLGAGIVRRPRS